MPAITDHQKLEELQATYEAGHLTQAQICRDWSFSRKTLSNYAKKYDWHRPDKTEAVQQYGDARLRAMTALSKFNKDKLLKIGGGELYLATEKYFQTAYEIHEATYQTLIDRKALVAETRDDAPSMDNGAKFEEVVQFYHVQASKMSLLTEGQKVTESVAKTAAVTMKGLRDSLGLDKETGKTGDIHIAKLIVNGLKEGRERIKDLDRKGYKDITAECETI